MRNPLWMWAAAPVFGLLVTACATVKVSTDYDHTVDFGQYHTFAIAIDQSKVLREGVDTGNTFVRDRIVTAINQQLAARNLMIATNNPDLVVRFVAGAR